MSTTVFVGIESQHVNNPVKTAIEIIAKTPGGADVVEGMVDRDGVEANIAIANSVATALRMVKETELTTILLVAFVRAERAATIAFANKFPERVKAVFIVAFEDGDLELVPVLLSLIAERDGVLTTSEEIVQ